MPLSAPSLTVADSQSGGAFTATLSGGDSGATNTLYRSQMTGLIGSMAQTSAGTRTGNGTITGTVPVGLYVWQVKSVLGSEQAWSAPYYQRVSDSADSLHERLQQDVLARCQALALPGISKVKRVILDPDARVVDLPDQCLCLVTWAQSEDYQTTGTNGHDDTGLPIYLVLTGYQLATVDSDATLTLCRQMLRRAFREYRSGITAHYRTELTQGIVVGAADGRAKLQGSSLGLKLVIREPRGLGV